MSCVDGSVVSAQLNWIHFSGWNDTYWTYVWAFWSLHAATAAAIVHTIPYHKSFVHWIQIGVYVRMPARSFARSLGRLLALFLWIRPMRCRSKWCWSDASVDCMLLLHPFTCYSYVCAMRAHNNSLLCTCLQQAQQSALHDAISRDLKKTLMPKHQFNRSFYVRTYFTRERKRDGEGARVMINKKNFYNWSSFDLVRVNGWFFLRRVGGFSMHH